MNLAFLIDECLSLDLVAHAQARGLHATHVIFRGLQGRPDRDLVASALQEDFVLVTNNRKDFLRLYAREEVHCGLVILVPGGIVSEAQVRLFSAALDAIAEEPDLVNRVVEVEMDGQVTIRSWPPAEDV